MKFDDIVLDNINLKNKKVISCDIFDTLIFRQTVEPKDVFDKVGKVALEKGYLSEYINPLEFRELRIEAEKIARQNKMEIEGHREVTLLEIYDCFPSDLFMKNELSKLEFQMEKKLIYLNDNVYSFLKRCKEDKYSIVLLSDMYLNSSQIKEILLNIGVELSLFDDVIVSSEYQVSKRDLGLYHVLLEKYHKIEKENIIHIGDNYISDYLNAEKVGIKAYHYALDSNRVEKYRLEMIRKDKCMATVFSLRKQLSFSNKYNTEEERFWYDFGSTILGPIFTSFIENVIKVTRRENIKAVFPLMRDGYIFQKMFEVSNEIREKEFKVEPLYVSRMSTFLGSFQKFDSSILEELLKNSQLTVDSLFTRFKIENHPFKKHNSKTFSSTKNIYCKGNISVYDQIVHFFTETEMYEQVNETINNHRKLLVKYLSQNIDFDERNIILDIGYSGTVSRAIEKALYIEGEALNAAHVFMISGAGLVKNILAGLDNRTFIKYSNNKSFLTNGFFNVFLLESFMCGDFGSVIDYEESMDGKVIPILQKNSAQKENDYKRNLCQLGIIDFYKKFLYFIKENKLNDVLTSDQATWLMERFMRYPTNQEAKYLGGIYTENEFNFQHQVKLCTVAEENKAKKLGVEKYLRQKRNKTNVWSAGVVERVYPFYSSIQLYKQSLDYNVNSMISIIEQLIDNDITECIVYGAGEMGKSLVQMLNISKTRVVNMVDRSEELWGTIVEGIEVISFCQSKKMDSNVYVIASLAFVNEIHEFIKENYLNNKEIIVVDYLGIYKYKNGIEIGLNE